MSLLGSMFISLIYLLASNLKAKKNVNGQYLALGGALLLISIGLMRFVRCQKKLNFQVKSSKFMPGGVLLILGIISVVLEVLN
jgi:uncharacterized membrane protein (UPF0136 family)